MSLTTTINLAPNNNTPAAVDASLTRLVQRLVARKRVHHAVVAMASGDGQHRWLAGAGRSDYAPQFDTPFFIASITKRFIITLVLQAHEYGELDLSAPITQYLPTDVTTGLHVLNGTDRTPEITIRHLASHTSGLPDHFEKRRAGRSLNSYLTAGQDVAWTFDDMILVTRQQQRPYFEPQDFTAVRQRARYSDTGFQLLIRILETVTHRSFVELLTARILVPLGLTQTWHPKDRSPAQVRQPAPLYARQHRVRVPMLLESTNDLISTTEDLLVFQRALLAGELFGNSDTRELLTKRRNRLRNIPVLKYGLGTMFFTVNRILLAGRTPVTLIGHSGATGTWLFYCPERDLHLAGTVDQTKGQAIPFRVMAQCLNAWRT